MNAKALDDVLCRQQQARDHAASPVTLAVLHPKGGVGHSTTVWHLGAELALRGRRVVLEDGTRVRTQKPWSRMTSLSGSGAT